MNENQMAEQIYSDRVNKLIERRQELLLARDILALELEIRDLKNAKTNGDTDTKENQSRESV